MSVGPGPSERDAAAWLAFARSDLVYARLGLNEPDVFPSQVGFHVQQAAEKAIKAVLVQHGVPFPRTHDLDELVTLWQHAGGDWPEIFDDITTMTVFAVRTRYPGDIDPPTRGEVQNALLLAEQVVEWAQQLIHPPPSAGSK